MVGDGSELTVGEVERRLKVSDTTVRRYVEVGWLRATRWTAGGHARIDPASVEALEPVLRIPPGPQRDAALEELRRRNRGDENAPPGGTPGGTGQR